MDRDEPSIDRDGNGGKTVITILASLKIFNRWNGDTTIVEIKKSSKYCSLNEL